MDENDDELDFDGSQSDTIIFFRPPNYYKDRVNEIVTEQISIPRASLEAPRPFSFIISDRSGDGMCCNWNGELDTGYTLYEGDPSNNHVIIDSKFEALGREVKSFDIHGERFSEVDSDNQGENSVIQINVTLMLDAYPDETGFFITNSLGRKLLYAPPGTFTEQNGIVEKTLDLYAGSYTFNIVDTFGDGINREDDVYRISVVGDNNRPSILSGQGNFLRASSKAFLLEGKQAEYPLHINMKAGRKPEDFGFSIYRLDRIEAVPCVASKSKGEYKVAYEDISEKLLVTRGGLYKIVFENAYIGVNGKIRINLGSSGPDEYNPIDFSVDTADTRGAQWWQVQIYAGEPLVLADNDAKTFMLRVECDHFSGGLEWILLVNHEQPASRPISLGEQVESEIVGYGSLALCNEMKESGMHDEKITIPRSDGSQSYTMIVTSDDNSGIWEGTPLQLYDGQIRDESLIISSERFEAGRRMIFSFSLADSGSACFGSMQLSYILSSALTFLALGVLL
jgi:hypothetical protein